MNLGLKVLMGVAIIAVAFSATKSCGRSTDSTASYRLRHDAAATLPDSEAFFPETSGISEDAATERAVDDLAYETYGTVGAPYGCTDDCGGHEAGFEWAKENGVTDGSCFGNSTSFNEGCQAYADAIEEKVSEQLAMDH